MRFVHVVTAATGLCVGAMLSRMATFANLGQGAPHLGELAEARRVILELKQQLKQQQPSVPSAAAPCPGGRELAPAPTTTDRWTHTPENERLRTALASVANSRGEVMLALANDVMMCSNRKTCWWNGGNVLDTFLKSLQRLKVTNVVVITLDDV